MKICISYTFWTGDNVDMLFKSIETHRPFVDIVVISIQSISNTGEYALCQDERLLPENQDKNGIRIIHYEPNLKLNTKENERIKHNGLLEYAKTMGCTHWILSAADHFYLPTIFERAIEVMKTNEYDVVLTKMRTHYKNLGWIMDPIEDYYMPFIHRIDVNSFVTVKIKYPVTVDPSVKITTAKRCYLMPPDLLMDHLSMIRPDIERKFRNAASSIRWKPDQVRQFVKEYNNAKIGDSITYFQGRKIVEWTEGD